MSNTVFQIDGLSDVLKPSEVPRLGNRRLVRLLPTPFGSRPAIWTSPYTFMDVVQEGHPPEKCRYCVLLMEDGSPTSRPSIICITIPDAAIEKFPTVPVSW